MVPTTCLNLDRLILKFTSLSFILLKTHSQLIRSLMENPVRSRTGVAPPREPDAEVVKHPSPGHLSGAHKEVGICTRVMRILLYSGTAALVGASIFTGPPREVIVNQLKSAGRRIL